VIGKPELGMLGVGGDEVSLVGDFEARMISHALLFAGMLGMFLGVRVSETCEGFRRVEAEGTLIRVGVRHLSPVVTGGRWSKLYDGTHIAWWRGAL
ncbi:MAG: hypothetical protein KDD69_11230, partial [Bdellovibrionales bacterium]|nr:hypothetical protein [Bdellovibrionales bacterium]